MSDDIPDDPWPDDYVRAKPLPPKHKLDDAECHNCGYPWDEEEWEEKNYHGGPSIGEDSKRDQKMEELDDKELDFWWGKDRNEHLRHHPDECVLCSDRWWESRGWIPAEKKVEVRTL